MEDKKQEIEKLPAEVRANMLSNETSVFFNVALFEQAQRIAKMFAESTMVPEHFQGNIGNCMIGLNYAMRLQADPFMVMQCLYIVHGRPGIEGKLVEAIINQSNKYSEPLEYEWLDPDDNVVSKREVLKADVPSEYGCQAFTVDTKNGKRVTGPKITWELIKSRGWYDRKGFDKTIQSNNWRTMPEMMFYYRSASWFSNKNCPELTLGMYTVEELQEITDLRKTPNGSYAIQSAAEKLNEKSEKPGKDIYKTQDVEEPEKPEKQAEELPAEEKEEDQIRKLFKDKTKLQFNKFLRSYKPSIPRMSQKYKDEIRTEHQKHFPDQEYPIDDSLPEEDKPDIPDKVEKPDPPIMLHCPMDYDEIPKKNDEGNVPLEWCKTEDNCNPEWQESCRSFQTYMKNTGNKE